MPFLIDQLRNLNEAKRQIMTSAQLASILDSEELSLADSNLYNKLVDKCQKLHGALDRLHSHGGLFHNSLACDEIKTNAALILKFLRHAYKSLKNAKEQLENEVNSPQDEEIIDFDQYAWQHAQQMRIDDMANGILFIEKIKTEIKVLDHNINEFSNVVADATDSRGEHINKISKFIEDVAEQKKDKDDAFSIVRYLFESIDKGGDNALLREQPIVNALQKILDDDDEYVSPFFSEAAIKAMLVSTDGSIFPHTKCDNPKDVQEHAVKCLSPMLVNKDMMLKLLGKKDLCILVLPKNVRFTELDIFSMYHNQMHDGELENNLRGVNANGCDNLRYVVIGEENLTGVQSDLKKQVLDVNYSPPKVLVSDEPVYKRKQYVIARHELAHAIHQHALTNDEWRVIQGSYEEHGRGHGAIDVDRLIDNYFMPPSPKLIGKFKSDDKGDNKNDPMADMPDEIDDRRNRLHYQIWKAGGPSLVRDKAKFANDAKYEISNVSLNYYKHGRKGWQWAGGEFGWSEAELVYRSKVIKDRVKKNIADLPEVFDKMFELKMKISVCNLRKQEGGYESENKFDSVDDDLENLVGEYESLKHNGEKEKKCAELLEVCFMHWNACNFKCYTATSVYEYAADTFASYFDPIEDRIVMNKTTGELRAGRDFTELNEPKAMVKLLKHRFR